MTTGATGRMRTATNYDEELDPHMNRIQSEQGGDGGSDSDEDADFEGGSSSDSSGGGESSEPESEVSEGSDAPKKTKKVSTQNMWHARIVVDCVMASHSFCLLFFSSAEVARLRRR
jgi:hypothetical protein